MVYPLLLGEPPVSGDHTVHMYKAWHFWEHLLPTGRLSGWSDFWFFGYPADELYPLGADIWVALFRGASLGSLSWPATYAVAFAAVFALCGWVVYAWGERLVGRLPASVGALLWLLDPAGGEQGGWHWVVRKGVWPQSLALALFLLCVLQLLRLLDEPRRWRVVLAALALAAACVTHPMTLALLGVFLPLVPVARWLGRRPVRLEALWSWLAAVGLGLALSAWWLLPMLSRWSWTTGSGYEQLGEPAAAHLALWADLAGRWSPVLVAAAVGAAVGLRRRAWGPLLLLCIGAPLYLLSVMPVHELLGLDELLPMLGRIQYRRFTSATKACLFPLAGLGAVQGGRLAWAWLGSLASGSGPRLSMRAAWVLVAPLALIAWSGPVGLRAVERVALDLDLPSRVLWWQDLRRIAELTRAAALEDPRFFRVAWLARANDHRGMALPIFNELPIYKSGFTPAKLYRYPPRGRRLEALEALSVRYVFARGPMEEDQLELVLQQDEFWLYEFSGWRAERWTLQGTGSVSPLAFAGEHVRLALQDISPGALLVLHLGHYDRWSATLDGEPVELAAVPAWPGSTALLLSLPVSDGELVLRYEEQLADLLGALLSGAALALLLALALLRGGLFCRLLPRDMPRPSGRSRRGPGGRL